MKRRIKGIGVDFEKFVADRSLAPVFFLVIYLIFPVKVSSIDGYGFANQIENNESLFHPHHLLYNFTGFYLHQLFSSFWDVNILHFLKIVNAFTAAFTLYILDNILKIRSVEGRSRLLWIIVVASSWGFMRFATENETYILPLFFSVSGSLWLAKYFRNNKSVYLFLAGFFTAFAALFHQIHFFWWLGFPIAFLFYKIDFKQIFTYALPALLVPIVYLMVFYSENAHSADHFFEFLFSKYYSGSAELSIDGRNLILTPINFIRTFLQVHGYMYNLLAQYGLYVFVLVGNMFCFFMALMKIRNLKKRVGYRNQPFTFAHVCVFILQLIFAFISHGNAEFMVMLPFVLAIILSDIFKNSSPFLGYVALGMFSWNMIFGLIPLSKSDVNGDSMVADFILNQDSTTNPNVFILFNRPRVKNIIDYSTKHEPQATLIYIVDFKSKSEVRSFIYDRIKEGKVVYTDCSQRPKTVSRASLLVDNQANAFEKFKRQNVDSVEAIAGEYYLTRLYID